MLTPKQCDDVIAAIAHGDVTSIGSVASQCSPSWLGSWPLHRRRLSPIKAAVLYNNRPVLSLLSEAGISMSAGVVSTNGDAFPLLHLAIACDKPARADHHTVAHLLDLGADANAKDAQGHTPLVTAVKARRFDLIAPLIDYGAVVDAVCVPWCATDGKVYGQTALWCAVIQHPDSRAVRQLLEAGADPRKCSSMGNALSAPPPPIVQQSTTISITRLLQQAMPRRHAMDSRDELQANTPGSLVARAKTLRL